MLDLSLQSSAVNTGSADEDGRLVLANGQLVAVLVLVADPVQGALVGSWFLEAGFGPCADAAGLLFESLEAARAWFAQRLDR